MKGWSNNLCSAEFTQWNESELKTDLRINMNPKALRILK